MLAVPMIDRGDGVRLAVRHAPGTGPAVLFLPGYMSDMTGTKATAIMDWAERHGRAAVLMDYSGCGASEGAFAHGSIRRWARDALAVIDHLALDRVLLVGSSMGGWIMIHVALALESRAAGLVGVAAAPDFTRWGLAIAAHEQDGLARHGYIERPSDYGGAPYRYHRALLDDAEAAIVLDRPIAITAPVRLLHGMRDPDVPWHISVRLAEQLQSADVRLTLVKDGDHRLSRAQDIALLLETIGEWA